MARTLNFKLPVQVLRSMRACKLCEVWRLFTSPGLVVCRCRAASEGPAFGHRRQPTSQYATPRRPDGYALSCSCACKRQGLQWAGPLPCQRCSPLACLLCSRPAPLTAIKCTQGR